jgi:diguanylate cyclase (GGDEF)-like protein
MSRTKAEMQALTDALADTKKELNKAYSSLEAVSRMAKTIHSTLDAKELSELVMNIVEGLMGFEAFALLIFNDQHGFLFKGQRNLSLDVLQNLVELVDHSRDEWGKELNKPYLLKESTYGMEIWCYPLASSDSMVGAFCASRKTVELLTSEDIRILSLIATQISTAYQNSILYELARKLSITDELTKVYNQCYLRSQLEIETRRAQRYKRPLSLLMVGIDGFASYCKRFGSSKGNMLLFETANVIQKTFRCVDLVARYGEEEFAVVLPETPLEGAVKAGERLAKAIESHRFLDEKGKRAQKLRILTGVSSFREGMDHEALIEEAAKLLHERIDTRRSVPLCPSQ